MHALFIARNYSTQQSFGCFRLGSLEQRRLSSLIFLVYYDTYLDLGLHLEVMRCKDIIVIIINTVVSEFT